MPHTSLDQLNDSERRVLLLLAEGHTIKSAAEIIGASPAALNERLRDARRKTGTGSSRELARKLRTQENRDKKTEVVPGAYGAQPSPSPAGVAGRWKAGVLVVSVIALGLMAASIALSPDQQTISTSDPIIGRALPDEPSPSQWQALLRSEGRDAAWATKIETALRERFERIAHVGGPGNTLRVTCGTSICEIAGTLPTLPEHHEQVMQNLQGSATVLDIRQLGLESRSSAFMSTNDTPKRGAFFLYYVRVEA